MNLTPNNGVSGVGTPHRALDSGGVSLERLAGNASLTEHEKLAEVSRQFEAVLLRQILAETQKPVIKSKFSDNSTASSIYRDLIGNQLAESISQTGAVGLAKCLGQQLDRQLIPAGALDPAAGAAHSHAMNLTKHRAESSAAAPQSPTFPSHRP